MCWDEKTSIITFVIGTIINLAVMASFQTETIYTVCIIWQWVLMMQLSEYLIWKDQNCGDLNKIGTNSAMLFNLTQPVIIFLVLITVTKSSQNLKIIASIVILSYISYIILQLNINKKYSCVKPLNDCHHLNLDWWNDFNLGGTIYFITIAVVALCLTNNLKVAIFSLCYIFIAMIISQKLYSCGAPSMWCWLVVPFPIFLGLFYKFYIQK